MKCPCCDRSLHEHGLPSVLLEPRTPRAPAPPTSPRGTNEWLERELIGYAMHEMKTDFVSTTVIYDWFVEKGWSLKPHPNNESPVMLLMMGGEGPWRDASLGRL